MVYGINQTFIHEKSILQKHFKYGSDLVLLLAIWWQRLEKQDVKVVVR